MPHQDLPRRMDDRWTVGQPALAAVAPAAV